MQAWASRSGDAGRLRALLDSKEMPAEAQGGAQVRPKQPDCTHANACSKLRVAACAACSTCAGAEQLCAHQRREQAHPRAGERHAGQGAAAEGASADCWCCSAGTWRRWRQRRQHDGPGEQGACVHYPHKQCSMRVCLARTCGTRVHGSSAQCLNLLFAAIAALQWMAKTCEAASAGNADSGQAATAALALPPQPASAAGQAGRGSAGRGNAGRGNNSAALTAAMTAALRMLTTVEHRRRPGRPGKHAAAGVAARDTDGETSSDAGERAHTASVAPQRRSPIQAVAHECEGSGAEEAQGRAQGRRARMTWVGEHGRQLLCGARTLCAAFRHASAWGKILLLRKVATLLHHV